MRNATLLLTLSASVQLSAQDFPFPSSDATWVQSFEMMVSPPPIPTFEVQSTANFCMDGSDTLIAGTSYTRLDYCNAGYVGGIRSVDEAVYFFPADSTQEYLLYDFGAAVGDTIFGVYVNELLATGSEGWMGTRLIDVVVMTKAQSAAYGGRTTMQVRGMGDVEGLDTEWIEGIGSTFGLFTFNPLNISQYWYGLECMSHNGTTYWNGSYTELAGTCEPQYMSVPEKERTVIIAYPNPTAGVVRVQGLGLGLVVRDALGRNVHVPVTLISHESLDLDLSALPTGSYSAQDGEGRTVRLSRE